jgi:hypothetical protein
MDTSFSRFIARRPRTALAAIAVVAALSFDLVVVAPAIVSFTLVVTSAVGWCRWLDTDSGR